MRKPRALREGDRISIVAPASPFSRDDLDAGMAELRTIGFEPVLDDAIFERKGYVAGPAAVRAAAFQRAWADPAIAALIAMRGGFGSVQLLPLLNAGPLLGPAKAFIGYSDNTSVLTWLTLQRGIVAFHGPMIEGRIAKGAAGYDRDSFCRCLCHAAPPGEITAAGLEVVRPGDAKGLLVGGTLTQLAGSLGTPYSFDPPAGSIVFFEDVNERPYKIERLLTQLKFAGILEHAAGVVFGEMRGCDEASGPITAKAIIADFMADFGGPVLFGLPSGHTTGPTLTLPLGVQARVVADGQPKLVIEEAAVA